MYLIRRIYKTKPGQSRRVATLAYKQAEAYHNAGQRSEFRVTFNGGTMPGELDIVTLEWTDDALMSPYRAGNVLPSEATQYGGQIRPLIESQQLEIREMMIPDKFQPE